MSQYAQPPAPPEHMSRRERRHMAATKKSVWPKVIGIVIALIVALAIALGVLGVQIFAQANKVKDHEQKALSLLSSANATADVIKITDISAKLPEIQQETEQANTIAHGFAWNVYAKLPWIGEDITTVQGMTSSVNGIVSKSIPQFIDVMNTLQNTDIASSNNTLNLQPIVAVSSQLTSANDSLQHEVSAYNNLPGAHISALSSAYNSGKTQLDSIAGTIDQLTNTFRILPSLLGANGKQTYAIVAMTPSEMRSSGGLIGSVGQMTTDNGNVSVGDFHSNREFPQDVGNLTATNDEKALFKDQGPLQMSLDMQDVAVYPNTQRIADVLSATWPRTSWGADSTLNGVITVDPAFLQELIKINGNVTLSNGTVLTGENTAQYLLNTVYIDYPNDNSMMDAVFEEAATQSIDSMFKNINLNKLIATGQIMSQMAQERHFAMYSFDSATEKIVQEAGFTASTPNSAEHPTVGVYFNEQNPSKMGWYAKRTATITPTNCKKTGKRTYHVEYTVTNTMTAEEAATLPRYITAANPKRGVGNLWEKTLFYAPKGGSISNFAMSGTGTANTPAQVNLDGSKPYVAVISVMPGQTLNMAFDVTTSSDAMSELQLDQTPLNEPGNNVTYEQGSCN